MDSHFKTCEELRRQRTSDVPKITNIIICNIVISNIAAVSELFFLIGKYKENIKNVNAPPTNTLFYYSNVFITYIMTKKLLN